jgi:hypothetical protein
MRGVCTFLPKPIVETGKIQEKRERKKKDHRKGNFIWIFMGFEEFLLPVHFSFYRNLAGLNNYEIRVNS